MRRVGYNSQRNNITENKLNPYSQCFATSNWMRMSYYCSAIRAGDDVGLSAFLEYMETEIGPKMHKVQHPSLYFDVQAEAVTKWLNSHDVEGHDVFDGAMRFDMLPIKLVDGPITIGTNHIGGLPDGHIILLVDYDKERASFVVNDPFGDAVSDYSDKNGSGLLYPSTYLLPYVGKNCRVLYWQK